MILLHNSMSATKFELQHCLFQGSAFRNYLLLSEDKDVALATANRMAHEYNNVPCKLRSFFYSHVHRYNTTEKLLSRDSVTELAVHAAEVELDNVGWNLTMLPSTGWCDAAYNKRCRASRTSVQIFC